MKETSEDGQNGEPMGEVEVVSEGRDGREKQAEQPMKGGNSRGSCCSGESAEYWHWREEE